MSGRKCAKPKGNPHKPGKGEGSRQSQAAKVPRQRKSKGKK